MVKRLYFRKAIIVFVFVNLFLASFVFAKQVEIKAADVDKIKTVLGIVQTFTNASGMIVHNEDLLTILNTIVKGGQTGTDVTYGLLVLSAFNEMELIDLVISQKYKEEAREYFDQVLKERTNLMSYWKGIGYDLPKIILGRITGPMAALTLNSFEISDEIIQIFSAFEVIKREKQYDGLWYYFDTRKQGNEPHQIAWEETKEIIGFAASKPFRFGKKNIDEDLNQLEQQFLTLYDNWSPYVTPFGIKEEYKKQVKNELSDTLIAAIEDNRVLTEKKSEASLLEKLVRQLENIKNSVAGLISRINPFKAGVALNLPEEPEAEAEVEVEVEAEAEVIEPIAPPPSEEMLEASPPTSEAEPLVEPVEPEIVGGFLEEITEPITEPFENYSQTVEPSVATTTEAEPASTPTPEPVQAPVVAPAVTPEPTLCERGGDNPGRFKVLINEVGWMGTSNSSDDEYIELKNIWGVPINLSGWQLLDKDRQIKIIFKENNILPANGFYLLERTNDDTVPGITADFIYTGALNNTDEALYLFNNNCQLEDEVVANPNWPAGDNILKKSMERFDLLNWYTGTNTPGSTNSSPPAIYTPAGDSTPQVSSEPEPEAATLSVVINEVGWMGTKANSADEWIELYNNTSSTIDLTNWTLKAADDAPSITFSTSVIPAGGYFLLERTDDNTVSDLAADLIYSGALGNTGERLELRNATGGLIDTVDCSSGWFSGTASPDYVSMERINSSSGSDSANWKSNNQVPWDSWLGKDANGNRINGTPKTRNSVSKNFTAVSAGGFTIDNNLTLTALGSPYLVEGSITVIIGAKLIIEPGVTIKFKHNTAWKSELRIKGELLAAGTETQKIIFTSSSTQPAAGDWEWLYLENASSTLKNIVIQYAGKKEGNPPFSPPYTRGALYVFGGNVEISASKIEQIQTLGIWLTNSAVAMIDGVEVLDINGDWEKAAAVYIENSSPAIRNSTFRNNDFAIWIEDGNNPTIEDNLFEENEAPVKTSTILPSFSNNAAQNNTYNGILVSGLGFSDTVSEINWRKTNLPYILESSAIVSSGKTLNIEAGVTVKLKGGGRIYINGTLTAQGTQAEKIIFTSLAQETAGSWHYIGFSASSVNSILDNIIVKYGGWYNVFQGGPIAKSGAIKVDGASLTIKNSLFESNLYAGLELINATTTFDNVAFNKNENGIYVEAGDCPNLTGVTFGEGDNANSANIYPSNCAL